MSETAAPLTEPKLLERLIIALSFLSRIPLPSGVFESHPSVKLAGTADVFAIVGAVIAVPSALVLAIGAALWPPQIAALLALLSLILITGALHDDGLADCADAFFVQRNTEARLAIMKDSRIGAYGTLALITVFALEWAALTAIINQAGILAAMAALLVVGAVSRAGLIWHWHVLPEARPDGLAASQGKPIWRDVLVNAGVTAIVVIVVVPFWFSILHLIWLMLFAPAFALLTMILARAKIGGMTGDTLGLAQKLTGLGALLALAIA
jgi:adenosylcobinamide-GDP ribazoletransferase